MRSTDEATNSVRRGCSRRSAGFAATRSNVSSPVSSTRCASSAEMHVRQTMSRSSPYNIVVTKDDLVARREKYIQRQIALDTSAVNVEFEGRTPQGSGPANRHGMPKLPVGQHEVKNWPVLDLGEQPDVALDRWKLEVVGLVENPFTLTWEQFLALPQVEDVSDFHCVTTWSRYDNHWRGVRFKTIAELAIPMDQAKFILCTGYDFIPGTYIPYTVNVPLARPVDDDVLLVHTWEGRPLPR